MISYWLNKKNILILSLLSIGIFTRFSVLFLPNSFLARTESNDLLYFLYPWYDYINTHGISKALGDAFTNYTPPYTYLLALSTLFPLPKVIAIKSLSLSMDFINAFGIYKLISIYRPKQNALLATGVFLCLPTIFMNSTIWGQADAFYTGFLIFSVYFFAKKSYFKGIILFSIAFSFKAQAVFITPLLLILAYKKYIKWYYFFATPIIYILISSPTIILGRDWVDVLSIYAKQGVYYQFLSANAPNLYYFIPNTYYAPVSKIGMVIAVITLLFMVTVFVKNTKTFTPLNIIFIAYLSSFILPFVLPKMHDPYFYPADVLSLVLAFHCARLWFVPLVHQISSGLAYIPFLFWQESPAKILILSAALINTALILYIIRYTKLEIKKQESVFFT